MYCVVRDEVIMYCVVRDEVIMCCVVRDEVIMCCVVRDIDEVPILKIEDVIMCSLISLCLS